jgi:drug/metabolite transporter (DMT)-like permease
MLWLVLSICAAVFMAIYFTELKTLVKNLDRMSVAASIYTLTGIILFAASWIRGVPVISAEFLPMLAGGVITNILATIFMLRALQITELSLAIPMIAFTPAFLLLTSPVILGEVASQEGTLGVLLICAGSYVLNLNAHHDLLSPFRELMKNRGLLYMLISSFLYSIMISLNKLIMLNSDMFFGPASNYTLAGLIFLGLALVRKQGRDGLSLMRKKGKKTVLFTVGAVTIAVISTYAAWESQMVSYVISVQRLSVLFSVIIGGLLLHEHSLLKRLGGAALMFFGVVIIALSGC